MDIKEKREIEKIIKDYINARGVSVLPEATAIKRGAVMVRGDLGGSGSSPQVLGVTTESGSKITFSNVTDGQLLKRSGDQFIGTDSSGGGTPSDSVVYETTFGDTPEAGIFSSVSRG